MWPTIAEGGYITLPLGGAHRFREETQSKVAHKWARWLHNPCRLEGPHRFRAGGENQKWPTSEQGGYITLAAWGVPTALERGRIRSGPQVGKVATLPCRLGGLTTSERRAGSEVTHKWARWLHNPCCLGGAHRFRAGGQNQKWPTSGQSGYITPTAWGCPPLQNGGQNQKWPTSGQGGYITLAA